MKARLNRWALSILGAVAAVNVLTLAVWPLTLFPDEAYYWDWSRHLDWCYYSKGPGVALVLYVSRHLLGVDELAVRLPAVILGSIATWATFRLALRLGTPRAALWVLGVMVLLPMFNGGQLFMTTDPPLAVCWAFALIAWSRAYEAEEKSEPATGQVLLGGLWIGLGLLAKPTMVLLLPPLLLTAARRGRLRWWLTRGRYFGALALIGLLSCPMLVWNAQRGWPTLHHLERLAMQGPGWQIGTPDLVATQLLLITPWLLAFLLAVNVAAVRRPQSVSEELLAWSFLLVLGFFALKSLVGKVEPNWPAPAYFGGIVVAGLRWSSAGEWRARWRRWQPWAAVWALILIGLVRFVPVSHYFMRSDLLYAIDTTRRAAGFDILGRRIGVCRAEVASSLGIEPESVAVVGSRYQTAAVAAFYTPGHPVTTVLPYPGRSISAYDFWPRTSLRPGCAGVLVMRHEQDRPPPEALPLAESWMRREVVRLVIGKRLVDRYTLFEFRGYRGPVSDSAWPGGSRAR